MVNPVGSKAKGWSALSARPVPKGAGSVRWLLREMILARPARGGDRIRGIGRRAEVRSKDVRPGPKARGGLFDMKNLIVAILSLSFAGCSPVYVYKSWRG